MSVAILLGYNNSTIRLISMSVCISIRPKVSHKLIGSTALQCWTSSSYNGIGISHTDVSGPRKAKNTVRNSAYAGVYRHRLLNVPSTTALHVQRLNITLRIEDLRSIGANAFGPAGRSWCSDARFQKRNNAEEFLSSVLRRQLLTHGLEGWLV